eukprot:TRINITY_DN65543_c0_g1_i1.p1 TRINITY_DN65543_c0_g1~~TRINITY_DN65543_c0_g1_i1.p1  ORF type:complete len:532 (+),score=94.75 TRINITY_DN65543_c0_g1_i1:73-1668(+)
MASAASGAFQSSSARLSSMLLESPGMTTGRAYLNTAAEKPALGTASSVASASTVSAMPAYRSSMPALSTLQAAAAAVNGSSSQPESSRRHRADYLSIATPRDAALPSTRGNSASCTNSPNGELLCGSSQSAALAARLASVEAQMGRLQAEVAQSSSSASNFAAAATDRLTSLEAAVSKLPAGSEQEQMRISELLSESMAGLMSDVSGCAKRLLSTVSDELRQALIVTNSRLDSLEEFRDRQSASSQSRFPNCGLQEPASEGALNAAMDASVASAMRAVTSAEARIQERVEQCVALIDTACSPANTAGLDALTDLVKTMEAISERVSVVEKAASAPGHNAYPGLSPINGATGPAGFSAAASVALMPPMLTPPVPSASSSSGRRPSVVGQPSLHLPERPDALQRLDALERDMPAMHDSLLVLWSWLRDNVATPSSAAVPGSVDVPSGQAVLSGLPSNLVNVPVAQMQSRSSAFAAGKPATAIAVELAASPTASGGVQTALASPVSVAGSLASTCLQPLPGLPAFRSAGMALPV